MQPGGGLGCILLTCNLPYTSLHKSSSGQTCFITRSWTWVGLQCTVAYSQPAHCSFLSEWQCVVWKVQQQNDEQFKIELKPDHEKIKWAAATFSALCCAASVHSNVLADSAQFISWFPMILVRSCCIPVLGDVSIFSLSLTHYLLCGVLLKYCDSDWHKPANLPHVLPVCPVQDGEPLSVFLQSYLAEQVFSSKSQCRRWQKIPFGKKILKWKVYWIMSILNQCVRGILAKCWSATPSVTRLGQCSKNNSS